MTENRQNKTNCYEHPQTEVIDIRPEGMLCGSDGGMTGGSEGNMDSSTGDL